MEEIIKKDSYVIYNGSMLDMLDVVEKESVDSVITDPPYHLKSISERFGKENSAEPQFGKDGSFNRLSKGFMGKVWDGGDISFNPDTWEKCFEVLKPGGYLLAFGGSRTFHRIAVAIEDAGFEIRDTIMWIYGSGFPKSMNISKSIEAKEKYGKSNTVVKRVVEQEGNGKAYSIKQTNNGAMGEIVETIRKHYSPNSALAQQYKGWGTTLKPAYEPIIVARKPFNSSVAENIIKYGVGGINIDECRVDYNGEIPNVGGRGKHTRGEGYGFRALGESVEANNLGRFPANVIHDGSEEVIQGFPSGGKNGSISRPYKINNQVYGDYGYCNKWDAYQDSGSTSRYFYQAKASKKDRDAGLEVAGFEEKTTGELQGGRKEGSAGSVMKDENGERLNPYAGSGSVKKNIHPTVKPCELMQYLVRLVSPKGATILDPFMGSGSTGKAIMFENRERNANYKFIGIDLEKEYCEIANARIDYALNKYEYDLEQEIKKAEKLGQLRLF